jgi:hypothetical protein
LYFLKIHSNILKSSQWSHSSKFPHYNLILHLMTPVVFDREYKPWNSSLCNTLHLPVTSSQTSVSAVHYWTLSAFVHCLQWHTKFHTNRQNYTSLYHNIYIWRQQTGIQKILDRIVAGLP